MKMIKNMKACIAMTVVGAAVALSTPTVDAGLVTYQFEAITNNDPASVIIGESQFSLEVMDLGGNQTQFTVLNSGPDASSITNVYFDSDVLNGLLSIIDSPPSVDFEVGGSPSDLPSGENIGFESDFLASAVSPAPSAGVNPGEQVGIVMDVDFNTAISSITAGELRVGIHAIGFDNGASESFVIPGPGVLAAFGIFAGLTGTRRRRRTA